MDKIDNKPYFCRQKGRKMEKQARPLEDMINEIKDQGVLLIEKVNRTPTYEKPYMSPYIVIGLNHRGWAKAIYNLRPVEFHQHDIAVIPPGYVLVAKESSDDYLASLLVIDPKFLKKLSLQHPLSHDHIEYHYNSASHLSNEQYKGVLGYFRILNAINQTNLPNRDELLVNQLEIGAQLIEIYLQENGMMKMQEPASTQQLVDRFQNAVVKHYTKSRKVEYYANLLCLSPKYFGSIIKEQTGITASVWIARYVIAKAKTMLHYRKDLSIQQISYELGFQDPATFTRYFKTNAGLSPKEYREQQE